MKTRQLLVSLMAVMTMMTLTGCQSQEDKEESALQSKLEAADQQYQEEKEESQAKNGTPEDIEKELFTQMDQSINKAVTTLSYKTYENAVAEFKELSTTYINEYGQVSSPSLARFHLKGQYGYDSIPGYVGYIKKAYLDSYKEYKSYDQVNVSYSNLTDAFDAVIYTSQDSQDHLTKVAYYCNVVKSEMNIQDLVPANSQVKLMGSNYKKLYVSVNDNGVDKIYEIDPASKTVTNTNASYADANMKALKTSDNTKQGFEKIFKEILMGR